jgi:hypothetical protein
LLHWVLCTPNFGGWCSAPKAGPAPTTVRAPTATSAAITLRIIPPFWPEPRFWRGIARNGRTCFRPAGKGCHEDGQRQGGQSGLLELQKHRLDTQGRLERAPTRDDRSQAFGTRVLLPSAYVDQMFRCREVMQAISIGTPDDGQLRLQILRPNRCAPHRKTGRLPESGARSVSRSAPPPLGRPPRPRVTRAPDRGASEALHSPGGCGPHPTSP